MTVWATRADQVDLRGPNPHDLARSRSFLYLYPTVVATVVAPRLLARFADTRDFARLAVDCWRPADWLRATLPGLIGIGWLTLPWMINVGLPHYTDVIHPLLAYLVAMYF